MAGSKKLRLLQVGVVHVICKAYLCEYNDIWLNAFIMSYARGEFPCGKLQTGKYNIKECIEKMFN